MLLTESDHPGDVFRVALCDHLPGLDVGGVGGDDDGDDGEFLAAVWASCDAVSRCNGVRQAVTGVDDVEDVVDVVVTAFATVVADAVVGAVCLPGCFSAARLASTRIGSGAPPCNWPASARLVCRCWPCTSIPPAAPIFDRRPHHPSRSAEPGCDWLPTPPGNTCSPRR